MFFVSNYLKNNTLHPNYSTPNEFSGLNLELNAIDLERVDPVELEKNEVLVKDIPKIKIRIADNQFQTAIASWRHDFLEKEEVVSENLKVCILNAKRSSFFYLLVDIISIEQDDEDLINQVINFSKLYSQLRSIIAYSADNEILRPWLRNEAYRILNSPTRLGYVLNKWELRSSLRPSLQIRQVCNNRLGISDIHLERLKLCDTYLGNHMILSDLDLYRNLDPNKPFSSLSVDLRMQKYASDILLIFEINRESSRVNLIKKLVHLRSNSIVVPALIIIWAATEGLSVSFRQSDWDCLQILERLDIILKKAISFSETSIEVNKSKEKWSFDFKGDVSGKIVANFVESPFPNRENTVVGILIRSLGSQLEFSKSNLKESFLLESLLTSITMNREENLSEDISSDVFENSGQIRFDDYDHHEDIYDQNAAVNSRHDLLLNPSSADVEKFYELVMGTIIKEHAHMRIDVIKLEDSVRINKSASHRLTLLLLMKVEKNLFFLDIAIAIADMWWFVFNDNHLQKITLELAESHRNGAYITEPMVIEVFEKYFYSS